MMSNALGMSNTLLEYLCWIIKTIILSTEGAQNKKSADINERHLDGLQQDSSSPMR